MFLITKRKYHRESNIYIPQVTVFLIPNITDPYSNTDTLELTEPGKTPTCYPEKQTDL